MNPVAFVPSIPVQGPEHLILGFAVDRRRPDRVVAVGGQRIDVALLSEDAGKTWQSLPSPGKGLRGAFLDGDELWVCGEYGFVGRSKNGGASFTVVPTDVSGCLFGVTRDDAGTIWVVGDGGVVLASVDDGATFKKIPGAKTSLSRVCLTPKGVLIPSDKPGDLYLATSTPKLKVTRLEIGAGVDLMTATITPRGTIVVVGAEGACFRSTDGGATFGPVRAGKQLLCGVCTTASGRVVAVGAGGTVMVSDDDGASFETAPCGLGTGVLWCCVALGDDVFVGGEAGLIAKLVPAGQAPEIMSSSLARRDVVEGVLMDDTLRAMVRPWRGCALGVVADAPPPLPSADEAWRRARSLFWACDRFRATATGKPSSIWDLVTGPVARSRRLGRRLLEERPAPITIDDGVALVHAAFDDDFQGPLTLLLHDAVADLLVVTLGIKDAIQCAFHGLEGDLPYADIGVFGRLRDRAVTASDADYAALLASVPLALASALAGEDDDGRICDLRCAASFLLPAGAVEHPVEAELRREAAKHIGTFGDLDIAHPSLLASADTAVFETFLAKNRETRHELFSGGDRAYLATLLARGDKALRAKLVDLRPRYDLNVDVWATLLARVDDERSLMFLAGQRSGKMGRVIDTALSARIAADPVRGEGLIASLLTMATSAADRAAIEGLRIPRRPPPRPGVDVMLRELGTPSSWVPPKALSAGTLVIPAGLDLAPDVSFRDDERTAADNHQPYDGHWRWQPDGHVATRDDDRADDKALLRQVGATDLEAWVAHREFYRLPTPSAVYVLVPSRCHARLAALGTPAGEGRWNHWRAALLKAGDVALPGLRAFAVGDGDLDDRLTAILPLGDVACVPPVIEGFVGKKHKALARSWILRHRRHALAGALAVVAAGGHGDVTVADAARVLRFLDGIGGLVGRDEIVGLARAAGVAGLEQSVTSLLDEDPLTLPGAKAPALPGWITAPLLTVVDRGGAAVDVADVKAMLVRLAASNADELHPALGAAKRRWSTSSLAALARTLFDAWLDSGADPKHGFCMLGLGVFGDDDSIRHLATLARAWPGESAAARAQQALDVLVLHGSDAALFQLSLIAEKSKFAAFKKGAGERIAAIAELRGLSEDELADRLVPTFGLEDDASAVLDFGPRRFTVTFDEHLVPRVKDEGGALLKDLPKPGKADDADLAKEAKKRLTGLKKDVKAVADLLLRRLERAMVEARPWSPDVFSACFVEHPLAFHVARRLLWEATDDTGARLGLFRLAEDKTLADVDDAEWVLPRGAVVRVVHPLQLDDDALKLWGERFADYELLQPFAQLGRPVHRVGDDERATTALRRHAGQQAPAPKLVFGLEARGYRRFDIGDGGAFNSHVKAIAGVRVLVTYEGAVGMGFIEAGENLTIDDVTFAAATPSGEVLRLGDVPAAVFSEAILDLDAVLA